MSKIMPCLWFDHQGEEAANFYVSAFRDGGQEAAITGTTRYAENGRGTPGKVMTVLFSLAGQDFMALNGGPLFTFSPATSLTVKCRDQAEIDHFWDRLMADGGKPGRCGWLTDRFGFSWQVVPDAIGDMLQDRDPARAARVTEAFMSMAKFDLARLERACHG